MLFLSIILLPPANGNEVTCWSVVSVLIRCYSMARQECVLCMIAPEIKLQLYRRVQALNKDHFTSSCTHMGSSGRKSGMVSGFLRNMYQ